MKINILLLVFLTLIFSSCSYQNTPQLSSKEKETIKKQLHNTVENLLSNFEKGDIESALEPYLHSDDFKSVSYDGSIVDFKKLKSDNEEVIKNFPTVKFITEKEDFNFLTNEIVLYLWSGKIELITDKGEKWKFDPETATLIFKKIDNQWKIIFQHESALPPAQEKQK